MSRKHKEDALLPEYDFSGGIRGKHYRAYRQGTTVVHAKGDDGERNLELNNPFREVGQQWKERGNMKQTAYQGELLPSYWLNEGLENSAREIQGTTAFKTWFATLRQGCRKCAQGTNPSEANTLRWLIKPLLNAAGWTNALEEEYLGSKEDRSDMLLYQNEEDEQRARSADRGQAWRNAKAIAEAKPWGTALDTREKKGEMPHAQIQRYLNTMEALAPDTGPKWGILTSGNIWRVYYAPARPRASRFVEIDLRKAYEENDEDTLARAYLLLRKASFKDDGLWKEALEGGQRWQARVAKDLSEVTFNGVFGTLANGITQSTGEKNCEKLKRETLIGIYRLMFLMAAEDRGLLPIEEQAYEDISVRQTLRRPIADAKHSNRRLSERQSKYWVQFLQTCEVVDEGDESLHLPGYNGGLFDSTQAPLLTRARVPDSVFGEVVYRLSHLAYDKAKAPRYVNYRDLSVEQLGSIDEHLAEKTLRWGEDGILEVATTIYARKDTGSYYTPHELVDTVIDETLGLAWEEAWKKFECAAARERTREASQLAKRKALEEDDPVAALLKLRVLDPAMGSGHFLIHVVDWLAEHCAEAIGRTKQATEKWLPRYESPVIRDIAHTRDTIRDEAQRGGWALNERVLTDGALLRRMVLKRCIYGVDRNPMTVELAKVSLWLHSFTTGTPLSFLDHHLVAGDSLTGLPPGSLWKEIAKMAELEGPQGDLYGAGENAVAGAIAKMQDIEERADITLEEAKASRRDHERMTKNMATLARASTRMVGLRRLKAYQAKKQWIESSDPLRRALKASGAQRQIALLASERRRGKIQSLLHKAGEYGEDGNPLNWDVAFTPVWKGERKGFDIVLGNPPWDTIKLQAQEWLERHAPQIAQMPNRAKQAQALEEPEHKKVAERLQKAEVEGDRLSRYVRDSGDYPLLGTGDMNLYHLFVERALDLVTSDGLVSFITPSGLVGDKPCGTFFRAMAESGRIRSIWDFENRRGRNAGTGPFFKDVHKSFKFCITTLGGAERRWNNMRTAFWLPRATARLEGGRAIEVTAQSLKRMNPTTGMCPSFKSTKEAQMLARMHDVHSMLGEAYDVTYQRMFDMSNDSGLFMTRRDLQRAGWRETGDAWRRWRKQGRYAVPLYQGRMIGALDDRAAGVIVNPRAVKKKYVTAPAGDVEKVNPGWRPEPQYWVEDKHEGKRTKGDIRWALAVRRQCRPTDERTVIAALLMNGSAGDSLSLLHTDAVTAGRLAANLSTPWLDACARTKMQGANLTKHILWQLPVIGPETYQLKVGNQTAGEAIDALVCKLVYTSHAMAGWAHAQGQAIGVKKTKPYIWNEDKRGGVQARIDGLYAHLYGLDENEVRSVLEESFPLQHERKGVSYIDLRIKAMREWQVDT